VDEFIVRYIGTVPQWGVFFLLIIVAIRTSPKWLEVWSAMKIARSNRNAARIRELEEKLNNCHTECQEKITGLHNELYAMRTQRNSEQAGIIRAILQTVDDPALRKQLNMLESVQKGLTTAHENFTDVGDSNAK
jgi:hypothetical protein